MTFGERAAINDRKCGLSACPERMVAGGVGPRNESGGGFRCQSALLAVFFILVNGRNSRTSPLSQD